VSAARESSGLLSGTTAVVTGGGRNLGRAIARSLVDAGAQVAIASRSSTERADALAELREADGRP
jgi:NAD(P)-dependent dehydrogenase (short-subunit alcohol dehydrogenase family)